MAKHQAGEADRLRGLVGKLRHPLEEVRRRAIFNINGKLSLGLMSPGELDSVPVFIPSVVAFLSELACLPSLSPGSLGRAAGSSSGRAMVSTENVSGPLFISLRPPRESGRRVRILGGIDERWQNQQDTIISPRTTATATTHSAVVWK